MKGCKLGLSVNDNFNVPVEELVHIAADCGFEAVSPTYSSRLAEACAVAANRGLILQSLHATFHHAAHMWSCDKLERKAGLEELLRAVEAASEHCIPVVVCHTWIGFDNDHTPTPWGLENHERLVLRATDLGVRIAYENTEGEDTLFALMEHFDGCDTVGFCWDSGHEMCYNRSADLLSSLGDRLYMTHLNDNMGILDPAGKISPRDDLHLLLGDGIADPDSIAARLVRSKKQEILNTEIKRASHSISTALYSALDTKQYVSAAYAKLRHLAELMEEIYESK
ncbi:MAG: sugar phosphate isomerase/epimerase [Clostridia bacterium]|nr:sugar phosphate isomerase/epimerase [Clostridia bacterium]